MEKNNTLGIGCTIIFLIFLILPILGAIAVKVASSILFFKISEWSFHWYYIETDIKFMTISLSVALWGLYFIALLFITAFFISAYQRICKRIKKENYDN